jgi:hypothetical protein
MYLTSCCISAGSSICSPDGVYLAGNFLQLGIRSSLATNGGNFGADSVPFGFYSNQASNSYGYVNAVLGIGLMADADGIGQGKALLIEFLNNDPDLGLDREGS